MNAVFFSSLVHKQLLFGAALGNDLDRWSFSQEASFSIKYAIDQPRFQLNISSNLWYIACIFQIGSALVGYEELTGELEPIRECEIFDMIINYIHDSFSTRCKFNSEKPL